MTPHLIEEGQFVITVVCPHCKRRIEIPATIDGVLKIRAGRGSLTAAMSAVATPHDCRQATIDDEVIDGELVDDDELADDGQFTELEAGPLAIGASQ